LSNSAPRVTLIMPVYNEACDLPDVLDSIAEQSYPHDRFWLIAVDGGSTDGSADIVRGRLNAGDIEGVVLTNDRRTIPTSLNAGLRAAAADDIVVRLDAHTTYAPDYVAKIVEAFGALPADVACVGGPQRPMTERGFSRALVTALYTNPMGLGGADFRGVAEPRPARGVYLGAWRAGVLQSLGGFDEAWEANEDGELAARLRRTGGSTYLIGAHSEYRVKRGPLAAFRQWGKYGFWRAQTLRRHPHEARLRHFIPPIALLLAAALLATPLRPAVFVLFALYCGGVAAKRAGGEPASVTAASCVFFPACQLAWTLGLIRGLLLPRRSEAARGLGLAPGSTAG
jgi:succinoglycan biosynthesis protein ExoA